jgi:lipoate-protein ligase A
LTWRLLRQRGPAAELFAPRDYAGAATVVVCQAESDALVLGSTQPWVDVADMPVVRRASGGGAVLVGPGRVAWVDVFVPAGHPLWDDDVGRAFWFLGDAWAAALADLGAPGGVVHKGRLVSSPYSRAVCFAGLGPGEVTRPGGGKAVGIAQRRTRAGALFQCAVALSWDAGLMARLLGLGDDAADPLAGAVAPVGPVDPDACALALLGRLPA